MTQKQSHTGMFRALSVILSIVFMWGFGITLLIVILNGVFGYSDNKADFRSMFLSMTAEKEERQVKEYLQVLLRSQRSGETSPGLSQAMHTYQTHFSPENTNFRF